MVVRKQQRKYTSFAGAGTHVDAAAMLVHNLAGQCEADTRTSGLGGEEGDEDAFLHLGFDAGAVVCHAQEEAARGGDTCREANTMASFSRAFLIRLMSTCSTCPLSANSRSGAGGGVRCRSLSSVCMKRTISFSRAVVSRGCSRGGGRCDTSR